MHYYDTLLSELHELGAAVDVNGGENTLPVEIGSTVTFSRDGRQIAVTCKRQHVDASGTPRHYLYTLAVDGVSVDAKNEKCDRDEWTSPQVKDMLGWRKYATGKGAGAVTCGKGVRVDMSEEEINEYCERQLITLCGMYATKLLAARDHLQVSIAKIMGCRAEDVNIDEVVKMEKINSDGRAVYTYLPTLRQGVIKRIERARANSASAKEAKKLDNIAVEKLDEGAQDAMMIRLLMARGMSEEQARAAVAGLAAPAATSDDTTTAK